MDRKLFTKTIIRNAIASRLYYTSRTKRPSLYSRISPLGDPGTSVVPELDDWLQNGEKVGVAELRRIVKDLRKRKRFTQALEVCNCFFFFNIFNWVSGSGFVSVWLLRKCGKMK